MKHCDNHADRMHFSGSDGAVFKAHRELIEEIASEVYEAEGPFDALRSHPCHLRRLEGSRGECAVPRATFMKATDPNLLLEMQGDHIVITLPGTKFRVVYRKREHASWSWLIRIRL